MVASISRIPSTEREAKIYVLYCVQQLYSLQSHQHRVGKHQQYVYCKSFLRILIHVISLPSSLASQIIFSLLYWGRKKGPVYWPLQPPPVLPSVLWLVLTFATERQLITDTVQTTSSLGGCNYFNNFSHFCCFITGLSKLFQRL